MAYRMAPVLVTLNDLEGHFPRSFPVCRYFKCNSSHICAAFYQISTVSIRGPVWRDFLLALLKDLFIFFTIQHFRSRLQRAPLAGRPHFSMYHIMPWFILCLSNQVCHIEQRCCRVILKDAGTMDRRRDNFRRLSCSSHVSRRRIVWKASQRKHPTA